jgi:hypothetical protein
MVGRMAQGLRSSRTDQQAEGLEKEVLGDNFFKHARRRAGGTHPDDRRADRAGRLQLASEFIRNRTFHSGRRKSFHPMKGETQLSAEC